MILSRNWLNDYVNTDGISDKEYCDKLTDTGSKVECFEVLGEDIENVVVAKVTAMESTPIQTTSGSVSSTADAVRTCR